MKLTKAQIKAFEEEDRLIIEENEAHLASGKAKFTYPNAKAKEMFAGIVEQLVQNAREAVAERNGSVLKPQAARKRAA